MAKLFKWFFRQQVSESEMDAAFANVQQADQDLAADHGLVGAAVGLGARG